MLSVLLVVATFLGSLSGNAAKTTEHPILKKLNKDENATLCYLYTTETQLYNDYKDIRAISDTESASTFTIPAISDIEGKIKYIYHYDIDSTGEYIEYGIGETSTFEDAIWVTDHTKWKDYDDGNTVQEWEFYDYQKTFTLTSPSKLIDDLFSENSIEILSVLWVILLLDIIITSIFGLFIARINPYGRIGVPFNLWFFQRLNGRLGRWLSMLKLFDYKPNDQWFVERHLVYKLDFRNARTIARELLIKRWRDVWFLPTAVVVFLMTSFEQFFKEFILSLSNDKQYEPYHFIAILFILSIVVSLLLATYYPAVWTYTDIGLKKYRISATGDMENVQSFGQAIRERIEILFGFTTVLSLGALSLEVVNPEGLPPSTQTSGSLLTLLELTITFTSIIAFFLIITCFVAPIIIVVGLVHFSKNHVRVMTETRKQLVIRFDTLVGTIQPNIEFARSDEAIHVYIDDKEEAIHYKI